MSIHNKPTILDKKTLAQSNLFKIEQVSLKFSNGQHRNYERICGRGYGAVLIIPITHDGQMLLIREYCVGTDNYQLGFPKGLKEQHETSEQAANRELKEEIGMGAHRIDFLKSISLAPGYFSASMDVMLAEDLFAERLQGDEPENLEVVRWPMTQVTQLLAQSDFTEARSVAALLLMQQWFEKGEKL